jgi:hypothetical protein
MEKTLLDVQRENAALKGTLQEHERTLHTVQQALATADKDRDAKAAAHEQKLEDILKRAQQQAQQPRPSPPVAKGHPTPAPVVVARTEPPAQATPSPGVELRLLRSDKTASFAGAPPSVTRADTVYLPAGSFSEGRVMTGVMATSRAGGTLPMLFSVTKEFHAPFQLQGSGLTPLATALPIQGCFIFGKAQADLGASRVIIQLVVMCVRWGHVRASPGRLCGGHRWHARPAGR